MRKIYITLMLVVGFSAVGIAQEINWLTLEEAVKLQKKNPKKIMMDMYTNWCGPCKMLDKNTFQNKDVADYVNKYFYAVKFNAEGNDVVNFNGKTYTNPNYNPAKANNRNSGHELARYFSVRSYPTIIYLAEDGSLLAPVIGYQTPQQLELYLKLFKNNDHAAFKTQQDFQAYAQAFKPEFKN
ncbi:thioredoxin family protein [Bizionia myxarmorum]|uniref:Thioredoxin fold domain-containing protein n=1 Tax=Bizionia myxarmorum TaxID=291186 RepID=A0A5D0RDX5_9FLAO|nr:thioredoxin fold domain-containing protein [Bizionia myxarmorum]TYB79199.1 thioredoxin fold domain-containing protein [Bizionia myxarmorum]